jgi:uncharacterized membrane protein YhaH (DUF805 family)
VDFQTAVTTVLTQKYADFSGRARRSEYWWFYLFVVIVDIVMGIIDGVIGTRIPGTLVGLALVVPIIAVGVRRLHDTGRSGWLYLIAFTIIGILVLIYWFAADDSQPGANEYGPSPKGDQGYDPNQYQGPNPNWGQG